MAVQATRLRTKQPEVRREQLLEAAERLFAQKGFAETTVMDVAEAAGVAKGTFYLYFPSKEHCVLALKERLAFGLVETFQKVFSRIFESASAEGIDLEGVVVDLMDSSFGYAQEHGDAFTTLFHRGSVAVDEASRAAEAAIVDLVGTAIEQLNQIGLASVTHPTHTARILFDGVHMALDHALCGEDGAVNLNDLKEAATEISLRALG